MKTRSTWSETTYIFPGSQQHCDSHLHQHTHTHHHTHLHNLHTHLPYMVTAHPQLSEGVAYRNEREELEPIGQPGHETHTLERREEKRMKVGTAQRVTTNYSLFQLSWPQFATGN